MERRPTLLEPIESINEAARGRKGTLREDLTSGRTATEVESSADAEGPKRFRPTQRHAMAVVSVHFDGLEEGERHAIRKMHCVVGRSEGDIVVEHDTLMSSKHFELVLPRESGARWRLRDLDSTNGTFVRVNDGLLTEGSEFLIGNHRYRFLDVDNAASATGEATPQRNTTQAWQIPTAETLDEKCPTVEEVTPAGPGARFSLKVKESLVGSDAKRCQLVVEDDAFVDAVHAKIHRDEHGRWHLTNLKSLNGTWFRVNETPIDRTAQVLAGEQRFTVYVP